jgi:hypothetical protein
VDVRTAERLARVRHGGQLNRFGEPIIAHVERVARAVPPEARALAYLHDLLERTTITLTELRAGGLTDLEHAGLMLLTHHLGQTYETYVLRIANAPGGVGRLARTIKLADLEDHLSHLRIPSGAPSYAWARRQIAIGRERGGDS